MSGVVPTWYPNYFRSVLIFYIFVKLTIIVYLIWVLWKLEYPSSQNINGKTHLLKNTQCINNVRFIHKEVLCKILINKKRDVSFFNDELSKSAKKVISGHEWLWWPSITPSYITIFYRRNASWGQNITYQIRLKYRQSGWLPWAPKMMLMPLFRLLLV